MPNEFKIHIFHRILALSFFLIMFFNLGFKVLTYSNNLSFSFFLKDNFFIIAMSLVSLFLALSFLKCSYKIVENEIIVKDFLRKDRFYQISEILDVEVKELVGPLSYIRIYFKGNRKLTIPYIEKQERFLKLIKET